MTDVPALLDSAIRRIAPEIDLDALDPDAPLQDGISLDSVGFLELVAVLEREAGIAIPEREYPALGSVSGAIRYLEARLDPPPGPAGRR